MQYCQVSNLIAIRDSRGLLSHCNFQACLKRGGREGVRPPRFRPRIYYAPHIFVPAPYCSPPPDFQALRHA